MRLKLFLVTVLGFLSISAFAEYDVQPNAVVKMKGDYETCYQNICKLVAPDDRYNFCYRYSEDIVLLGVRYFKPEGLSRLNCVESLTPLFEKREPNPRVGREN